MNYKIIKLFVASLLLVAFQGCINQPQSKKSIKEIPTWFLQNSSNSTTIYGYGSSKTLEEAKSIAREDISKSIKVKIKSSLTMTSRSEKSSELKREKFTQQTHHSISEYTQMILTDIKIDKYVQVNNTWYVRMSYLNLPIIEQIKKTFNDITLNKMDGTNPLVYSSFSKNLKASFGYIPNYSIFSKNGIFFVDIQNHNFILLDTDIKQFLLSVSNPNIEIKASKQQLKSGDYFHFNIVNHSNDNYSSLIQIDEVGKVIVHFGNLKAKQITYPNLKMFEGLEAGIVNNKDTAVEMYLVISCREKNNFAIFEQTGLNFNTNKDALRFPNLYKIINKCDYSSSLLRTTK